MAKAPEPSVASRRSTLEQERSQRTRAVLIEAAQRLWSDRGVDAVTVSDLCDAAGVSKGLYYFYFAAKDDLLVELLLADLDEVARAVDVAVAGGELVDDVLALAVEGVVRHTQRRPRDLLGSAAAGWLGSIGRLPELADGHRTLCAALADAFAAGQARGEIGARHSADELGRLLEAAFVLTLAEWATAVGRRPGLRRRLTTRTELIVLGARP
jgi:AcrR family transcriptional regulator